MYKILQYVYNIIVESSDISEFDFQETASDSTVTPKFKVTLGVMPDYLFDGKGMRIDGVTKNKTANKFGIIKGDIVVKLGSIDVNDMMQYMLGLSKFEKGDSTRVKVLRNNQLIEIPIVFQ